MLNVASLFLGLHLGQQLGEAHVESSGCPVEVDAPPRSLAGEGHTKQNKGSSRPLTTKRGKALDAFALSPEIGK